MKDRDPNVMNILGVNIDCNIDYIAVERLNYLQRNPRVNTILHREEKKREGVELEQFIFETMMKQPSVKNIYADIEKSKDLTHAVFVRQDTMEVVEGNSRLTVYKDLNRRHPQDEKWKKIRCQIVATLTDEQEDAFLYKEHVDGKTTWKTYEKAMLIYNAKASGCTLDELMERFPGTTKKSLQNEIWIIEEMDRQKDAKLDNYSYYKVIRTNSKCKTAFIDEKDENPLNQKVYDIVIDQVKNQTADEPYTALQFRRKMPEILKSNRHKKKFVEEKNLDSAYNAAKNIDSVDRLLKATDSLKEVRKKEVINMVGADYSKFMYQWKKLKQERQRIKNMLNLNKAYIKRKKSGWPSEN